MFTPRKQKRSRTTHTNAAKHSFAIIVSRYNEHISEALLQGALECFREHNVQEKNITVVRVPGAFEIPLTAQRLAATKKYAAVVCLGAVIRGETAHFEHVAGECARGIREAAMRTNIPVIFGVLTTNTLAQAKARAKKDRSNKGWESASAAIDMAELFETLS
ncbi:MAG TPA: 6,7-dimethyl-8-ribityllumazine synthase [Candidatus Kapabacteria bacterium]|nr:6,7-dimethyl-8-ribityllumazine synthase [Candidatus Kapabacteria bacterium]